MPNSPSFNYNYSGGSQLWLRYIPVNDPSLMESYRAAVTGIVAENCGARKTFRANRNLSMLPGSGEKIAESSLEAARDEMLRGLGGLLDKAVPVYTDGPKAGAVVIGTPESSPIIAGLKLDGDLAKLGKEGFLIRSVKSSGLDFTVIAGNTETGALYGTFRFLRLIQTQKPVSNLNITDKPRFNNRQLNNWEMSTDRMFNSDPKTKFLRWEGDSGLPLIIDSYIVFARTAASTGVNQLSVNMINADDVFLGEARLKQISALADVLRPYGVKVLIAINYTAPGSSNAALDQKMRVTLSAPTESDPTAVAANNDPYSRDYQDWWTYKTIQITELIPDFAGYTVKANSEGMPGPQQYGYTHGDGANGIAAAISYKGDFSFRGFERKNVNLDTKVFWRTFVYEAKVDPDRLKRPYIEFGYINDDVLRGGYVRDNDGMFIDRDGKKLYSGNTPTGATKTDAGCHLDANGNPMRDGDFRYRLPVLDVDGDTIQGGFLPNAYIQTKNGPLDFMPVEPVHPLFGLMDNTTQMFEVEVFQEYTGGVIFPCFLGPMWERVLNWETNAVAWRKDRKGKYIIGANGKRIIEKKNAKVGEIVEGSFQGQRDSGMVGVCNLDGSPGLCTSQQMSQANWFTFGRQSWDWTQNSRDIADDWARMTWGNDSYVLETVKGMMMGALPAVIAYENPLGLHHQFNLDNHYAPCPWEDRSQDDWGAVYYAKSDSEGIGYNRTGEGSNSYVPASGFVEQYFEPLRSVLANIDTCPEELIAWFHHVPWKRVMKSGRTYWNELVYRYQMGVQAVSWMRYSWDKLKETLTAAGDSFRFNAVQQTLKTAERDAARWRDIMINYLQQFSEEPVPVNDAPLSISIKAGGRFYSDFNLSIDPFAHTNVLGPSAGRNGQGGEPGFEVPKFYTIKIPNGAAPVINEVNALMGASCEIIKQAADMNDEAIIKVTNTHEIVGNLLKYYHFRFVHGAEEEVRTSGYCTPAFRINEDFNSWSLNACWSWIREDPDHWSLKAKPGTLTINAQAGDLAGNTNNAKNILLRDISGYSWTAETKLSFSKMPDTNYEQAGIIAYLDDDNYIKVSWMNQDSGFGINLRKRRMIMNWELKGVNTSDAPGGKIDNASFFSLTAFSNFVKAEDFIYLRLVKEGKKYRSYFSFDGKVWRWIGQHSAAWTIDLEPRKIGLFAWAGTVRIQGEKGEAAPYAGDLSAHFSYFKAEGRD